MQKIKLFLGSEKGRDIMTIIIVILVALASFGLGRLSKAGQGAGLRIEYQDQAGNALEGLKAAKMAQSIIYDQEVQNSALNAKGAFFASSKGKKYYPVNCAAGKSIKLENRLYFATREEAVNRGYELSSSCR